MPAPRPPYSLGHSTPVHPPEWSLLYHPTRRAQSFSSASKKVSDSSGCSGLFLSSHARNSLRKASSSGVKLKSISRRPHRVDSAKSAAPAHRGARDALCDQHPPLYLNHLCPNSQSETGPLRTANKRPRAALEAASACGFDIKKAIARKSD